MVNLAIVFLFFVNPNQTWGPKVYPPTGGSWLPTIFYLKNWAEISRLQLDIVF